MSAQILEQLGVKSMNSGACADGWIDTKGSELVSYNPSNGEPIASVRQATGDDYEKVITASEKAFADWRMMPAPNGARSSDSWATSCAPTRIRWAASSRSRWGRSSRRASERSRR